MNYDHLPNIILICTPILFTILFQHNFTLQSGRPIRSHTSVFGGVICLLGGIVAAHRLSYQRLKGYRENSVEVAKHNQKQKQLKMIVKKRVTLDTDELRKV